jgi:hypothetical protein
MAGSFRRRDVGSQLAGSPGAVTRGIRAVVLLPLQDERFGSIRHQPRQHRDGDVVGSLIGAQQACAGR